MDRVEEIMDVRCGADLTFCRRFIVLLSILGGGGRKGLVVSTFINDCDTGRRSVTTPTLTTNHI